MANRAGLESYKTSDNSWYEVEISRRKWQIRIVTASRS